MDGEPIRAEERVYYALHKPTGSRSTRADERGRATVIDLLPHTRERLYPVGRLDANSEGLMILTDGAFANPSPIRATRCPRRMRSRCAG